MEDHETAPTGRRSVPLGPTTPDELPARPLATATVDKVGDAVVVAVAGEIDLHTAPHLRDLLVEEVSRRPRLVVADLTGVTFLSSSGISALLDGHDSATLVGTPLRLACLPDQIRRTLTMTGLITWFATYDDVSTALS